MNFQHPNNNLVRSLVIYTLALLLSTFTLLAKAEHQYCVVADRSDSEKRICISGSDNLESVLVDVFGPSISAFPLQSEGLPSLTEADKMVLIYPQSDGKGAPAALTVFSTPLDPRWHAAVNGCESGDQNACAQQGGMMIQKGHSAPRDVYQAQSLLSTSCDADVPEACHFLGQMNFYGLAGKKNLNEGIDHYKKACSLGHSESCLRLGYGFTGRFLEIPEDITQAAGYYDSACTLGDMSGCTELGYAYAQADGVNLDKPKAARLWKKACDGDEMIACFNYGDLVEYGSTINNKEKLALTYYRLSCDLGYEKACAKLTN